MIESDRQRTLTGQGWRLPWLHQWLMYSGAYDGSRFTPRDQINRTNVQRLSLPWVFQTGVRGRHETTPLIIDGVMYLTTPQNHAYALDVRTDRPLWHYERNLPKGDAALLRSAEPRPG
jgi:alcohol dehydrogenase (cytochrome c)